MTNYFDGSRKGRGAKHGASGAKLIKRRKSWRNRNAVSEIIGNMLILSITVIMFSGIFVFVSSMDGPSDKVYTDFVGSVVLSDDGKTVNEIKIVNKGGHPLEDHRTAIYLFVEGDVQSLKIAEHIPLEKTTWNTGVTWTYYDPVKKDGSSIERDDNLRVMIADTQVNTIVWESTLQDNSATSSQPIIADRYLASKVGDGIWIRDTSFTNNQQVALFVNVLDAGNDLSHLTNLGAVYADVSSLGGPKKLILSDTNGDNWWSETFQVKDTASGIRTIHITAVDDGGRTATASLTVNVRVGDGGSTPGGGGSGGPPGNLNYNGLQGLNVFKYREWMNRNYSADPTTQFDHGEQGVVVVASKFLVNTDNANDFFIVDSATGTIYKDASSPNVVFHHYDYYSGYYIYTAAINTDKLDNNKQYMLQIQLRDSWLPNNNLFFATVTITVGDVSYPTIETFSDPEYKVKADTFTTSQSIYVKIQNKNGGDWYQMGGTLELSDFFGNTPIKRVPNSVAPNPEIVNPITFKGRDGNAYLFKIDLTMANQDPWAPGNNAYMLKYDVFKAGSETYFLSKSVNVIAPKIILDAVVGAPVSTHSGSVGTTYFIEYYRNNNQWVPPDFLEFTSQKSQGFEKVNFVRLGDINNNGKNDIVAVFDGKKIYQYLNNGLWTRKAIDEVGHGTISAIALGNLDMNSGLEIIVGFDDGRWGFYRNDGLWSFTMVKETTGDRVESIQVIDTHNTFASKGIASSMDVVVGFRSNTDKMWLYRNSDGIGIDWTVDKWTGGASTQYYISASHEQKIHSYVPDGMDYSDTAWEGVGNEVLYKVDTELTVASRSTYKIDAPLSKEQGTSWTPIPSNFNPNLATPFTKVTFSTTYSITTGDFQIGNDNTRLTVTTPDGVTRDIITIATKGTGVPVEFDLTEYVKEISDLSKLKFEITNNLKKGNIAFTEWRLIVNYERTATALEHVWEFSNIRAGSTSFKMDAHTSGELGHDSFDLWYSTDGTNYNMFGHVDSTSEQLYEFSLPISAAQSKVYIKATNANLDNQQNTSLTVGKMCIYNVASTPGSVGPIKSIQVHDMDNDGYPDIVVSDNDEVWVLLNDKAGSYTIDGNVKKISLPGETIRGVACGFFSTSDTMPGLAVATGSGIYIVSHTDRTTWANPHLSSPLSGVVVNNPLDICLQAGDVDGDGDDDLLVATGTTLSLYINGGSSGFRKMTIDNVGVTIQTIYLGKTTG